MKTCLTCYFFKKGYRLQGLKIPDFCEKHFHSQSSDDPACKEYQEK